MKNLNVAVVSILIGLAILLGIVFTSETIFGDLTREDSYKPLWVVVPVFAGVFYWLYRSTKKK